jgi:nitric oxide dioxygenase
MSLQVELLEKSFAEIKPHANDFVSSFYDNLFTANPEAKPLFDTTDMEAQKKKLLSSLVLVVENLRKPDVLDGALRGLGARHVKYGALPEHYPLVGSALLSTFEQYLKEDWTPQVKQAWIDAYVAISDIMLDGADYSEAEIALPTPIAEPEPAKEGLQVELLEKSFAEIEPHANEFVSSFYDNLFTANPEAKPLFDTTDMEAQKKKLLSSLVLVVENLRKPDVLDGALRGLGARHVKYGALPEHYPLVGSALLTTFEQYLKEDWTPQVKQAWVDAYGAISNIMLDGADYSEAEIALPTPTGNIESIASVTDSTDRGDRNGTEIAFEPEEINSSTNFSSEPVSYSKADMNSNSEAELTHNSGKASLFSFLGGGIMGIIAIILALLI